MERIAFKSNSFEQADKWDVKQHINLTVKERLSIAHDVILNNSSLENLKKQVINKHNYYMELIKNAKMS